MIDPYGELIGGEDRTLRVVAGVLITAGVLAIWKFVELLGMVGRVLFWFFSGWE